MSRASSLAVIIGRYFSPRFIAAEKSFLAIVVNRLTQLSTLGLAMFAMSQAGAAGAALGSVAFTGVEIASAADGSSSWGGLPNVSLTAKAAAPKSAVVMNQRTTVSRCSVS